MNRGLFVSPQEEYHASNRDNLLQNTAVECHTGAVPIQYHPQGMVMDSLKACCLGGYLMMAHRNDSSDVLWDQKHSSDSLSSYCYHLLLPRNSETHSSFFGGVAQASWMTGTTVLWQCLELLVSARLINSGTDGAATSKKTWTSPAYKFFSFAYEAETLPVTAFFFFLTSLHGQHHPLTY